MIKDKPHLRLKAHKWFRNYLNQAGILYFEIKQDPHQESKNLLKRGGKRPDFLLFTKGKQILVEVKCLDLYSDGNNEWYCISKKEINSLLKTEQMLQSSVYLAIITHKPYCTENDNWYFVAVKNILQAESYKGSYRKIILTDNRNFQKFLQSVIL